MALLVTQTTISVAWVEALDALLYAGGQAVNLAVAIAHPTEELEGVRTVLDEFLAARRATNARERVERIDTVANTIFPRRWYIERLGQDAERHLYELAKIARPISRQRNRHGTYFERFVSWPGPNGQTFNQLDQVITRLRSARQHGRRQGNAYEVGVAMPADEEIAVPVFCGGRDRQPRGFPCLSHLSFSLQAGALHLTALYRSHEFVRRAYGNYLGLGHLLHFVANQAGFPMGELVCVSASATAEIGHGAGFGRQALEELVGACRCAQEEER